MANKHKVRGDKAEREVSAILSDLLGLTIRRKLGAGRQDDIGDIDGVPDCTIQVADWKDTVAAIREKVPACVVQQLRAGTTFGACFIRRYGGSYIVVMTPEQFATLYREATNNTTQEG